MNISVEGIEKILSDEIKFQIFEKLMDKYSSIANNRSENKKDINAYFHGVIV